MTTITWKDIQGTTYHVTATTRDRAFEIARAHGYRPPRWWQWWRYRERNPS